MGAGKGESSVSRQFLQQGFVFCPFSFRMPPTASLTLFGMLWTMVLVLEPSPRGHGGRRRHRKHVEKPWRDPGWAPAPSRDQLLMPRHRDRTDIAGGISISFPITYRMPPPWNLMPLDTSGPFLVSVGFRGMLRPRMVTSSAENL